GKGEARAELGEGAPVLRRPCGVEIRGYGRPWHRENASFRSDITRLLSYRCAQGRAVAMAARMASTIEDSSASVARTAVLRPGIAAIVASSARAVGQSTARASIPRRNRAASRPGARATA